MFLLVDFLEIRGLPKFLGLLVYTCGNIVIFVGIVLFIKKVFISKADADNNSYDQKPEVSKLGIWSMVLGVISLCISCLFLLVSLFETIGLFSFVYPFDLDLWATLICVLSSLSALLVGAVALSENLLSKGKESERSLATLGILTATVSLYCLYTVFCSAVERHAKYMQGLPKTVWKNAQNNK